MACEFKGSMQHYLDLTEVVFMTQGKKAGGIGGAAG
jgi:hypothetical protein